MKFLPLSRLENTASAVFSESLVSPRFSEEVGMPGAAEPGRAASKATAGKVPTGIKLDKFKYNFYISSIITYCYSSTASSS